MKVFLDGELVESDAARVSVFDRGFLFGDGVYEAIRYFEGRPVELNAHVARLERSLEHVGIRGFDSSILAPVGELLLDFNATPDAGVYWQITRGAEPGRWHAPRDRGMKCTVFAYAWPLPSLIEEARNGVEGVAAILRPDLRWRRCDIKSTNLLPNVLARIEADRMGAEEAILFRDEAVTEGASTNIWIYRDGELATTPVGGEEKTGEILHGTMRRLLLETAQSRRPAARPIHVDELRNAEEVIITSSTRLLRAVTRINGDPVGQGEPGPIARTLFDGLLARIRRDLGTG